MVEKGPGSWICIIDGNYFLSGPKEGNAKADVDQRQTRRGSQYQKILGDDFSMSQLFTNNEDCDNFQILFDIKILELCYQGSSTFG